MTLRALSLGVMLVLFTDGARAQPRTTAALAADPEVASQVRLLDEWIRTQLAYNGLPGMVVGIVHDQEVVLLRAYGMADVERAVPMRTDSVFRIASHSKMFTAIAVMQLRDAGRLQLDEPVRRRLPWFRLKTALPDSPEITLRHLLTHTAGIPRESPFPYWTELEFPGADALQTKLQEQDPVYPAATRWKYSNLGYAVAGFLVEKASGRPYRDYVQAQILSPLGMTSTTVGAPPADRLATAYGRRMPDGTRERLPLVEARAMNAAAGVSSSAEDLIRFLSWQMRLREEQRTEVLRPATLREMQRVQWLRDDWKSGWGLGFAISHSPERDLVGHGGSYPGYRTVTLLSPKEKVGVVVLTNAIDGDPGRYARKAFEWVAPAVVKAARGSPPPPAPDASWDRYVGTYRSRWGDTKVLVLGGKLVAITPLDDDFLDTKLVLVPAGEHVFRMEAEGVAANGEQARFEVDAAGKVSRVFFGANYALRVEADAANAGSGVSSRTSRDDPQRVPATHEATPR